MELLIVIVVIGVLSAMMMLSSTEAVSSARASNIISNLRNLKTAALAWYADHVDIAENSAFKFVTENADGKTNIASADVVKYMSNEGANGFADYDIKGSAAENWYVVYQGAFDSRVSEKLAGRAASVGLLGQDDKTYTEPTSATDKFEVKMLILKRKDTTTSTP